MPLSLLNLWHTVKYQSRGAKLVFSAFGAPFLLLALLLAPSPMTAMKAEIYSVIIPLGIGGTLISALVETKYRRCLHRRRMDVVVWPKRPPH